MTWLPPPAAPELPASLPVFPLPGLVFFPGTVLPLHVFEPRYQRMVRDARAGHGLIAMALLKPGWEPEYYDAPEVHALGCCGRLIEVVELPEGRFNIKLAGLCRTLFLEFDADTPYRTARVRALPERVPPDGSPAVAEAKSSLLCAYAAWAAELTGETPTGLEGAVSAPLHALVNTLCAHVDLPAGTKQRLLRCDDLLERCHMATEALRRQLDRVRRQGSGSGSTPGESVH